jgi:hypothetical protein
MKIEFLEGIHPHWLAAAIGSAVSLKAVPGSSLGAKLGNFGAGFAIAAYLGPAVVEWLAVRSEKIEFGIVFAVGMCGLVLTQSIIAAIKSTDFGAWIAAWLPRKKGE